MMSSSRVVRSDAGTRGVADVYEVLLCRSRKDALVTPLQTR